ncbi:MAG: response regulator [Verrucomicrobia bacterium]|nr:response regulator [Verrucomicrobiota bacterium]
MADEVSILTGMNILIVDDEPVSRELLRSVVSAHEDHQITVVGDGEAAWTLLNEPGRSFDVAFVDILMPELDGLGLLTRIRSTKALGSTEVVLCTASNDRSTIAKAIQLGARHYVVKPFDAGVITAKLDRIRPPPAPPDLPPAHLS